jgi:UDP-N-acetylmuramoyl-tripeptide--D-alanyl-D-alanine ligase
MERRSLKYVAEAVAGELRGPAAIEAERVCTDSRQARTGDLFFALTGEKFDGHAFAAVAAEQGAVALVVAANRVAEVERQLQAAGKAGLPLVLVDDPRRALGRLAAQYRRDFSPEVVAVAGSNGKTTTKELLASVLRQGRVTLWSEASFNNDIGVPMTLLKLARETQAAVLELGTNHPGELAPLMRMAQPRVGVVPSLGREHLEFFGDMRGVVEEEGWLAELLPANGRLLVNADNAWMGELTARSKASVTRVGLAPDRDWRAQDLRMDDLGTSFTVRSPQGKHDGEYRVNLLGRHQVTNALLALAAGAELGLDTERLRRGLAECAPPKMRMQVWEARGARVLDDAYNANADSMLASLETLAGLPCAGRRLAVLGDMGELGTEAEPAHREVGRRAAELKLDALYAVGRMAGVTAAAARAGGLAEVRVFAEAQGAGEQLRRELRAGDLVLLKASRAARLERVGEYLRGGE